VDEKNWSLLIGENTMISAKRKRVNDGILLPKAKTDWLQLHKPLSGVLAPDPGQERILPVKDKFVVVKRTFITRLRMATYTDHFPVYVILNNPVKPKK
jgi:hypothetical protein